MKTDIENLSETRLRISVELPFADLSDDIEAAYKKVASQVQIPGFRKGRVPRQILDQRVGRGPILEEVVNSRVPRAYEEALAEADAFALGQPDLEITEIEDNDRVCFVAEVDIRPEFDLPDYKGLSLEVASLEVTEDDVAEQLDTMRTQFGSYTEVDRPVQDGDVLLIDIRAESEGEQIEDLAQTALSYEVGKDGVIPGLDAAVTGAGTGETRTFDFTPEFGDVADQQVDVSVTVTAVRERELPQVDDDFAIMASEFDTAGELIEDLKERIGRSRLMERGQEARDKAHEALLELIEMPIPEGVVKSQVDEHFGDEHGDDDHRSEVEENARRSLKAQFIFDRIAEAEEVSVGEEELSQWLMMQAPQYGMAAEQFAQALVENGQVPTAVAEVRRGKTLALVLESAIIVDTNGDAVDLKDIERALSPDIDDDEHVADPDADEEIQSGQSTSAEGDPDSETSEGDSVREDSDETSS